MKAQLRTGVRLPPWSFAEGEDGGDEYDIDLDKALASPKAKAKLESWAERSVAAGLKAKNQEVLGKLSAYKLEGEGDQAVYIDPAEAKTALEFVRTEGKDLPAKIQNAVQDATHRLEGQLNSAKQESEKYKGEVGQERQKRQGMMVGYELREALRDSGIKTGKLPLHEKYLRDFITVESDNEGKEHIVVIGDDGQPRYGKDGLMTLSEFVEEYRDKDDIAEDWQADARGGSGQTPGSRIRTPGPKIDPSLPAQERLRQHRAAQARAQ